MSSNSAVFYQLKGMVASLPDNERTEAEQACSEIMAIAGRSDASAVGLVLATAEIAMKGEQKTS